MDDNENIKVNLNREPVNDDSSQNIYHHIRNVKVSVNNEKIKTAKEKDNVFNINQYLMAAFLSVLIYITCALTANVELGSIISVEIPLIAFLSLIFTYIVRTNNRKKGYCGYTIIAILMFFVNPSYTFLLLVAELSQAFIDCITKIFTNKHEFNVLKEKETEKPSVKKRIVEFIHRIKYHLLLSILIFMAFTIFAYFYPSVFQSLMVPAYQGMQEGVQQGTLELATTPLFINNFSVALRMCISGIVLSIPNVYLLVYNGLLIGFTGTQLPLSYFLSFTLPHGILELTAIMLAGASGFKITQAVITLLNGVTQRKDVSYSKYLVVALKMVIDSLIIMVIVFVLLMIAAYVEANLTIPIGKTILGI